MNGWDRPPKCNSGQHVVSGSLYGKPALEGKLLVWPTNQSNQIKNTETHVMETTLLCMYDYFIILSAKKWTRTDPTQ